MEPPFIPLLLGVEFIVRLKMGHFFKDGLKDRFVLDMGSMEMKLESIEFVKRVVSRHLAPFIPMLFVSWMFVKSVKSHSISKSTNNDQCWQANSASRL